MTQPEQKAKGHLGLVNLGNTCFLNSALQVLRHIHPLVEYFKKDDWSHRINENNKYAPMVRPIVEFATSIWRDDLPLGTRIAPRKFYQTLTEVAEKVGYDDLAIKHQQADAGEALLFLLDCLHEGLAHKVDMAITGVATTPEEKRWITGFENWIRYYKKQWSITVRILHGQKMSATTCKTCQYHSETFEPWSSLNVPVVQSDNPTLDSCLEEYFKDEIIEDYFCDGCSKKQPASHTNRLFLLPEYIVVILNRSMNDGSKLHGLIDIDTEMIDLDKWFIGNRDITTTKFKVTAVADHHGSARGGHYTASARDKEDPSKWFHYDDDSVQEIDAENVIGKGTYVILLQKLSREESLKPVAKRRKLSISSIAAEA